MPKISVFIPDLRGGGAERMMVHLINEFALRDIDCELVLANNTGPYLPLVSDRVSITELKCSFMNPIVIYRLYRHLVRSKPDVLLSAMTYPNVAALLARRLAGVPPRTVISERVVLTVQSHQSGSLKERLKPPAARMTYNMADHIISVNDDVSEDLVKNIHVDRQRISSINNPVLTEDSISGRDIPDHPWLQDHTRPVIIAAGRLARQKDYPTLLNAMARIPEERDVRLIILGEGPDRADLESLAGSLGVAGRIDMPGFAQDPYAWMQHADLFVLSSAWEGSPNVLVEAMACGCPVVSTDCPGGSRRILEEGRHGPLVPVGDADALAQAITATLDKPVDRQQLLARAADFSARRSADQYLQVLLPEAAL
jgi:glycosyltransferase involved in cell wall biosynthesis